LKALLFAAIAVVVLNPNLKRAAMQIRHTIHPERLVRPDFPALPLINAHLDEFIAASDPRYSEARLVAKYVLRQIRYVNDYKNWGNIEYWPTAAEVWNKQQEDCDGRAILATSILRSRGYGSTRLIVGLNHMWIMVDENELDPYKPARYVALLNPDPNFSLNWSDGPRPNKVLRLARAFVRPTALRDNSAHLFADIPGFRKAILVSTLLLLCYHPCRSRKGMVAVLALGLVAVAVLATWQPDTGQVVRVSIGGAILGLAILLAFLIKFCCRAEAAEQRGTKWR
jgi:hypothetical protein